MSSSTTSSSSPLSFPIVPNVEVRYTDLRYSIKLAAQEQQRSELPNVFKTIFLSATFFPRLFYSIATGQKKKAAAAADFLILDEVSGVIKPGTMTLILAPPGHGKSSFLKALTQMLPQKELKGSITYSGISAEQSEKAGVYLGSLCQYVNQIDEHLPQLTVRETFEFIRHNNAVDPSQHGFPHLAQAHKDSVEDIVTLLNLKNCQNTVIGNDLMRGVSGGEKKRVTVGEGLLSNARMLALDEISTGLDSAVTFDICKRLRQRASDQGLTVVTSLLQPTPETLDLFDDIILMREGAIVYHGARKALPAYLISIGYKPPTLEEAAAALTSTGSKASSLNLAATVMEVESTVSVTSPSGSGAEDRGKDSLSLDLADWLIQFLANPELVATANGNTSTDNKGIPFTTSALKEAWKSSSQFKSMMNAEPSVPVLKLEGSFALKQYSSHYPHSWTHHLGLLIGRQKILMQRNLLYVRSRLISACVMSIILGGLYYQRTPEQGATFLGTFLNSHMIMGFANLSEMAAAVENKYIAYRQVANGAYPSSAYVASSAITHIPVAICECFIFTGILYGMTGMGDPSNPAGYFFYWVIIVLFDLVMRNLLVFFALSGKTLQASQTAPMPIIALMIIFAGFLVTRNKMGWLEFVSYIDPIAWGIRAVAINEFSNKRYDVGTPSLGAASPKLGSYFLSIFDIPNDWRWMWGGFGYMFLALAFVLALQFRAFGNVRFDRNIGSTRKQTSTSTASTALLESSSSSTASNSSGDKNSAVVNIGMNNPMHSKEVVTPTEIPQKGSNALTLVPMTVSFKNIKYTVELPKNLGGGSKVLLQGISGVAKPGRMLALMGASGAGKTTLLDVLGGRKNSGKMEGLISLNGFPKDPASFNRITAYVEQSDIHMPLTTVREALEFSAGLRLTSDVSTAQRTAFIDDIIDLLELRDLSNRLVGAVGAPDGLAPHERKRLTIGVELVSNAPVIFLDEPTSGLDARAASIVMRVIRKVANTGRTIICTIHQPSAELFFMFDDLLLLQRGGFEVFYGELGPKCINLLEYLPTLPNISPCPPGMNPASWMLDSLQGFDSMSSEPGAVLDSSKIKSEKSTVVAKVPPPGDQSQEALFESNLGKALSEELDREMSPKVGTTKVTFSSRYATSYLVQYTLLLKRSLISYSRNIGLNYGRLVALSGLNLLFGIIWYKIADINQSSDLSGIQSLVSSIFMAAAFAAMINLQTIIPSLISVRAVFYREQNAAMYHPALYSLSILIVETPWLAGILLPSLSIGYFMFGLAPSASGFFFHFLVCYVLALVYISIGQTVASIAPTFEVAQSITAIIGPLYFLFGGLWSPPPQMVEGARWFCWIDPITYAFKAVIPQQFYCGPGSAGVPCNVLSGPMPPKGDIGPGGAVVLNGKFVFNVQRYEFVKDKFDVDFNDQWINLGNLAIFIAVFQVVALLATLRVRHIVR
jgi:ABC-type multidrug transport system ATPase subunit/ABC-type multidrug transport system permease subunit